MKICKKILFAIAFGCFSFVSGFAEFIQEIECNLKPINRTPIREDEVSPLSLFNEVASANWCGYVGASALQHPSAGSVSAVSGSWTVPTLHSTPDTAYCATWVGIDGFSSSTVEQIGTAQDWVNGRQQNYAWFEMYPLGAYEIEGFPVNKGDLIGGSVTYVGSYVFRLVLTNYTERVSFTVPSSYTTSASAQRSCAEWIMEAPSSSHAVLPLAKFGSATFTNCSATINGVSSAIINNRWQSESIEMETNQGKPKAIPSSTYGQGQDFMVTWESE